MANKKIFKFPFNLSLVRDFNLKNPKDWATFNLGYKTKSGTGIDSDTALSLSAVWSAVRLLSQTLAQVPLSVYRRLPNGGKEIANNHPINRLIHSEPNRIQTSFLFRELGQQHLELRGNFYAYINRDNKERPTELTILNPDDVTPVAKDGDVFYKVKNIEALKEPVPSRNILHVCGPMGNGLKGSSPIAIHRENLGLAMAAQDYGATFFGNGANVDGILTTDANLKPEQRKAVTDSWKSRHGGLSNSHSTAVLEAGLKYQRITIAPDEAQFIQSRKFQTTEIARIFGVAPHLIADLERSTNNNIEQQSLEFIKFTMLSRFKRWENELDKKLFREDEKGEYFVKFNLDGLQRGDAKTRSEFYSKMLQNGVMNINEVRNLENLNAIVGGDKHFVQLNLTPIDQLGEDNGN